DAVLGLKPGGSRAAAPADANTPPGGAASADAATTDTDKGTAPAGGAQNQAGPTPQQAWWNMLQHQFNQVAGAAAATMQSAANPTGKQPTAPAAKAATKSPARKRASKSTTQSTKPQS